MTISVKRMQCNQQYTIEKHYFTDTLTNTTHWIYKLKNLSRALKNLGPPNLIRESFFYVAIKFRRLSLEISCANIQITAMRSLFTHVRVTYYFSNLKFWNLRFLVISRSGFFERKNT